MNGSTPTVVASGRRRIVAALAALLLAAGLPSAPLAHAEESEPSPTPSSGPTTEPAPAPIAPTPSGRATPSAKPTPSAPRRPSATPKAPEQRTPTPSARPGPTSTAVTTPTTKPTQPRATASARLDGPGAGRVAAPADAAKQGTRYSTADGAVYWVPTQWVAGEPLVISGEGWRNTAGDAGSVIAVKLDEGALSTTGAVRHPATGAELPNKTIWAAVQADDDGAWTLRLPYPTSTNSTGPWAAGQPHSVRLLTGSMLAGDVNRSAAAPVSVVDEAAPARCVAANPPSVRVGSSVAVGGVLQVSGRGFCHPSDGGSRVAIKIDDGAFSRLDGSVHANRTIWAIVQASAEDGSFDVELQVPDGTASGRNGSSPVLTTGAHTLRFLTGSLKEGDTGRSLQSATFTVGRGPAPTPTPTPSPTSSTPTQPVTCRPTSPTPSVRVGSSVAVGGVLQVSGRGFCHPSDGGSRVAIKIDDGAFSRLDGSVHANRTIWAIVQASAEDGSFDVELQVPDGTASGRNGSSPVLTTGAHTLRFLTGSLKEGDTGRSLQSATFTVGTYRPTTMPDPVEATEDLTGATRAGVTLSWAGSTLTVRVPGAASGDWIYLNLLASGSPRFPWGDTWFRASANGTVIADLSGITLPAGTSKVSVQSGNLGRFGTLLGWAPLTVAHTAAPPTPSTTTTIIRRIVTTVSRPPAAPGPATSATAPTTRPAAPVERASQLGGLSTGGATATQQGTKVTVTVPRATGGQWVYVYLYSGASIGSAGWVQVNAAKAFTVDLKALPDGRHRIVALGLNGSPLGWVEATKGDLSSANTTAAGASPPGQVAPQQATAALTQPGQASLESLLLAAAAAILIGGGVVLRRLAKPAGKPSATSGGTPETGAGA